jgi:hypothetical protein
VVCCLDRFKLLRVSHAIIIRDYVKGGWDGYSKISQEFIYRVPVPDIFNASPPPTRSHACDQEASVTNKNEIFIHPLHLLSTLSQAELRAVLKDKCANAWRLSVYTPLPLIHPKLHIFRCKCYIRKAAK